MPFGLGFFATAGAGGAGKAGSFDLLETQVLGSAQASVTFSSLSTYASTYQHLQIRTVIWSNQANFIGMKVNGTTGARSHVLRGRAGSVGSFTEPGGPYMIYAGTSSSDPGFAVVDLLDPFETTKNKVARAMTGFVTSTPEISMTSNLWEVTASTTSLEIFHPNSPYTFSIGSRFSLYGIRAV